MINEISKQYAQALFELVGNDEKIYDELLILKEVLLEKEVLKVFEHPSITLDQKKEIIKNSLDNRINKTLLNFLYVLVDHDRLNELDNITMSYKRLLDQKLLREEAIIYTTYPLTSEQKIKIQNILEKKYHKNIIIVEKIDKTLVGGIKVEVGFDELDASTINKLQKIKDILKG